MRIRLLVAAYPKGPRRAEIEDLLLMAAADGRSGYGVRGAFDVLRHGLRARLGRSGNDNVVALAALFSVVACFLFASAANRLAWEAVPDLPSGADRVALGELVAPGLPVHWSEDASDDPFPAADGVHHARKVSGSVAGAAQAADVDSYLASLGQRLQAAGWHIQDTCSTSPTDDKTGALLARDAHLMLTIENVHDVAARQSRLGIEVHRAEPPWVSSLTIAAGLLGTLLGWLIFGWASRRTEHRRAATIAASVPAILGLMLLTPAMCLGLIFLNVLIGQYSASVPFWTGLAPANEYGFLASSAGVALGAALVIAACSHPGRDPQRAPAV